MKLKILGVSGSLREGSHSLKALSLVLDAAAEFGAEPKLLDLRIAELPIYSPGHHSPTAQRIQQDVGWADALVLATPDYHGSMSGAMKNFLDYHWRHLAGKLFGFVCASDEKGLTAMDHMRTAVRQCYGWSLPYGAAVNGADFDGVGQVSNPKVARRLRMMARDLAVYGRLLRTQFQQDVAQRSPEGFAAHYI